MRGVHGILYSLFDADGWLDRKAIRAQVQICLNAKGAGIAALGLATEVAKLFFV
jgi:4-hydroxy-tetrahydrodipicolinate synthase